MILQGIDVKVLKLIFEGSSIRSMSYDLETPEKTVKSSIDRIYKLLSGNKSVKNRAIKMGYIRNKAVECIMKGE